MTSKYDRLDDHLATLDGPEITLTFAEVEAIIGPLPKAARHVAGWWGRGAQGYYSEAYTLAWFRAGFVAEWPDFKAGTVTFRRVA